MTKKTKLDSWKSLTMSLGDIDLDKRMNLNIALDEVLGQTQMEMLYRGDYLARKIIDLPAREMVREWIEFDQTVEPDIAKKALDYLFRLKSPQFFKKALKWSRLYGGSALIMIIEDNGESHEPVNLNNIKTIRGFFELYRFQLWPNTFVSDTEDPNFGQPATYQAMAFDRNFGLAGIGQAGMQGIKVVPGSIWHRDRVLVFDGLDLPQHLRDTNNGWGDSVLQPLYNALRNYNLGQDGSASLIADFAQAVIKIKGLHAQLAADKDEVVKRRLSFMNLWRSILNAIVIDADGEEFERKATPVTGLVDIMKRQEQALVAGSEMPHTILFGESPSGLGATGQSENDDFDDYIAALQEEKMTLPLDWLIELVFRAKDGPTNGEEPKEWGYDFNSLTQLNDKEISDTRLNVAKSDDIYIGNGVLDANEVAKSRFGGAEYSMETNLDTETRAEMESEATVEPEPEPEIVIEEETE